MLNEGEKKMLNRLFPLFIIAALLLTACGPEAPAETPAPAQETPGVMPPPPAARTLRVMTHDSFRVSEDVVRYFEAQYDINVQFLLSGDTGTALNQAILARDNPLADVFFGVDNTFLSRALNEGIFEPYDSPLLAQIPVEFQLDPENRALPVDYGDVCLNYDRIFFEEQGLQPPQDLEDLLQPEYRGMLVVQNPATSSPGLAFLLATLQQFGEEGYLDFWRGLVENDLLVVSSWETAYLNEFSGSGGGGARPIVVSYGSSPPAEVIFAETPIDEPPTAAVTSPGSCFRQIEFVGILAGAPNREEAELWVDFMLSTEFQEDMPLQMFVFPVNPHAELDQVFTEHLAIAEEPAYLDHGTVGENRERWLQEWTQTVLR
jgi:thiamine transport system substrate-binding protein